MKKSKKDLKKRRFKFGKRAKEKAALLDGEAPDESDSHYVDLGQLEPTSSSSADDHPRENDPASPISGAGANVGPLGNRTRSPAIDPDDDDELYLLSDDEGSDGDTTGTKGTTATNNVVPIEDWNNEALPSSSSATAPSAVRSLGADVGLDFNMFSNPLSGESSTAVHADAMGYPAPIGLPPIEHQDTADVARPGRRNDEWKRMEEQRRMHAEKKRLQKEREAKEASIPQSPGGGTSTTRTSGDTRGALDGDGEMQPSKGIFQDYNEPSGRVLDDEEDAEFWTNDHDEARVGALHKEEGPQCDTEGWEELVDEEYEKDAEREEMEMEKRMLESLKEVRKQKKLEELRRKEVERGLVRAALQARRESIAKERKDSFDAMGLANGSGKLERRRGNRSGSKVKASSGGSKVKASSGGSKVKASSGGSKVKSSSPAMPRSSTPNDVKDEVDALVAEHVPSLLWADDDDIWDGDDDALYGVDRSYEHMELERKYPIRLPQKEGKMYVKKEGRPKWIHEYLVLKEDKLYFLSKKGKLPPLRLVDLKDKKTTFVWHKESSLQGKKKTKAFIVMTCHRGVYHVADPSAALTEEWRDAIHENRQREWGPPKRKTTKSTKSILFRFGAIHRVLRQEHWWWWWWCG